MLEKKITVLSNKTTLRIVLSVFCTIVLFVTTVFFCSLAAAQGKFPGQRKRKMIRELAETTWSLRGHYYEPELSGELTRREAQQRAILRIRNLRYGPGKRLFLDQRYGAPDDHAPLSD